MSSFKSGMCQDNVGNSDSQLQQDVNELLKYLDDKWKKSSAIPLVCDLMTQFKITAQKYVSLADNILPNAKKQIPNLPIEYYYGEVLKKISDHVRLLEQLLGSLARKQSKRISELDAIQGIIWDISKGIPAEQPILVPIVSTQFMYVDLTYVSGIGIIGVPPYVLTRPYPDLPILWHEVAGYWMAHERASVEAEKKVRQLKDRLQNEHYGKQWLWDCYRDQYVQSLSHDVRVKLTIKSGKVLLTEHSKLVDEFSFKNIDEDYDWQMCWLGQIKEDLFGLQYLGEAMKKSMDVALTQAYETPIDIGDAGHPPPDLRLKIADEYLKGESASSFETFEKVDEISGMARVIVDYLRPGFPRKEKDSSPLNPAIVKLVASFAQNAKALSDQAPQQPKGRKKLMKDPDIISAFKESQSKLKLATPIQKWNQIWIPNGFEQSDIDEMQSTELYDQQKAQRGLAYLQGIVFTNTDKNEDEGQPPKKPKPTQFPPQQSTKT